VTAAILGSLSSVSKAFSQDGADGYPLTDTWHARALLPSTRAKEGPGSAIL